MLKFMLTTECPRKCFYCITKNVKAEESTDFNKIRRTLQSLSKDHKEIMITGGEPTVAKYFVEKIMLAREYFTKVHLTTSNFNFPTSGGKFLFNSITLSLHGRRPPIVDRGVPIYASILTSELENTFPKELKDLGFAGLTINENQREVSRLWDCDFLPKLRNFSYKLNLVGHCMNEIIILPNLKIIKNFKFYLGDE